MNRQNITSGSKWETIVGYSRAVRVGGMVHVAGTTAVSEDGQIVGPDDPYAQTKFILQKIEKALEEAGATMYEICIKSKSRATHRESGSLLYLMNLLQAGKLKTGMIPAESPTPKPYSKR